MTIDNLEIQIKTSSEQASYGINKLAASLTTLKQVAKGGAGLTSIANQISKLNTALAGITAPTAKIQSMVAALNRLGSVQKGTGLSSVINQIKKLPEITETLEKADMGKFATQINKVTTAIKPLATEMDKVSRGFSALPTKIQKVIQSNERLSASNRKTSKSYGILGTGIQGWAARLMTATFTARAIGNVIGGWIQKSNAYVENLNLFTVSLGEYAEEAKEYAETVGELMGIDPSDWLRAQGIFNTLATGFGITSDKAAIMSKNLTQLSYDLSSFYNISVDDAMTKLQSAFSGELEPVRRLGYDLSQVKLQSIALDPDNYSQDMEKIADAMGDANLAAIALEKGIKKPIASMTQAEKSMLRYYALMTQVTVAQGDMARTLNAPSNQLRIFNAQLEQAKRALGNIFIPALNQVLPYLIAFLKLLRAVANEIALFFGFELPEIDYSDVNKIGDGVSDKLDDATASAKKFKNAVAGFDELNILGNDDDDNGSGLNGVGFDLDVPEYDFLKGLTESKASQIFEEMRGYIEPITSLVEGMADGFSYAFGVIGSFADATFFPWLKSIGEWAKENPNTLWLIGTGLGAIAAGMLVVKAVGTASTLLGLPNLLNDIWKYMNLVYAVNGRKLIPTLLTLATRLVGVGLAALAVYSALQLVRSIIDVKQEQVQGWEAFRQIVGWLATTIGLAGLALTAFGIISAGVISAGILAIGAIALKWADFSFGAQIVFAYAAQYIITTLYGIMTVFATIIGAVVLAIKELVLGVVWLVAKGIEMLANGALSAVKKLAEAVDKVIGTDFASKVSDGIDLTSGIEQAMDDAAKNFGQTVKEEFEFVASGYTYDVWESDYLQSAASLYEEAKAKEKQQPIGMESMATDLREAFESFKAGNDEQKLELEAIEQQQAELNQNWATQSAQQTTELQTANVLNEDLKKLQTDLNTSQLATNEIESVKLPESVSLLTSIRDILSTKLDEVRRACENIKINITKVYRSGADEYAAGGFPTTGQMFIANEAGPELVGRIGTKTAVANQDQITEGIAKAVYNAMMSANQSGGNQNINLFIDGKQVNAAVEKAKREKGTSIMTGGLIYG